MGTTWSAKWLQPTPPFDPAAIEGKIPARLEQLEQVFSTYRPDSVLSRFNRAQSTNWISVPPELARAAALARDISLLTGGAFDVTIAPLLALWGFGPQRTRDTWPADSEIAAAHARVDWRRLEVRLDPPALRKTDSGVAADLSSVAKGFAVDELSRLLTQLGAVNHLVQIGGDLRAAGPGPGGAGWRVAIEEPVENSRTVARVVDLVDRALSTSGNYRNTFQLAGRRIGHLVDPRSGLPASHALAAVSVVADSCATSSALATGLYVLGPAAGPALARRETIAAWFFSRKAGRLHELASPAVAASGPSTPP
jgi:thiamine biosynthesis lipoprotein